MVTTEAHGITLGNQTGYVAGDKLGQKFTVGATAVTLLKATKSANSTATVAYLQDSSRNVLASANFSGNDATFDYDLSASTTYYITGSNPSIAFNGSYGSPPPAYPIAGTYISWTHGTNGASDFTNLAWNIVSIDLEETATGTNFQCNIGDAWKSVAAIKVNIGDSWKTVASAKINIGDSWKVIF